MMSNTTSVVEVSLSELISIHRNRLRLSQSELAKDVGISRNYVSLIERGFNDHLSYSILRKICFRLGMKITIGFDQEEKRDEQNG